MKWLPGPLITTAMAGLWYLLHRHERDRVPVWMERRGLDPDDTDHRVYGRMFPWIWRLFAVIAAGTWVVAVAHLIAAWT